MKANSRSNPSPAPAALSSSGGGSGPYYWSPSDSSPPAPPNPHGRLVILKQNSLSEDKFVRNGESCNLKIVVKNSPFIIQVGYEPITHPPVHVDMKSLVFDARLIYDTPDEKEVDFIKLKPLETKISVNEPGTLMNCEARLKVLTSQLEDSFFKIRFRAYDARTKKDTGLMVLSHSIKTVSKPDKLRKKKKLAADESLMAPTSVGRSGVKLEPSSLLNNPVAVLAAAAAMSTVATGRATSGPLITPPDPSPPKRKRSSIGKSTSSNGAGNEFSDDDDDPDAAVVAALGGAPLIDVMLRVEQSQATSTQLLARIAAALDVLPSGTGNGNGGSSGTLLHSAGLLQSTATADSEDGAADDESLSSFTPLKLGVSGRSVSGTSDVLSTAVPHSSSVSGGVTSGHHSAAGSGGSGAGGDTSQSDKEPDLDACFSMLLQALETLPPGPVRADKVKSVVRTLAITRTAASELHDLFWAEGLGRALGNDDPRSSSMMGGMSSDANSILGPSSDSNDLLRGGSCNCADCPAKKELERVENFYREVFSMST